MPVSRSGWMLGTLALASVVLIAPGASAAATAVTGPDFPQALLAIASLIQLILASWVLIVIALAQLAGTSHVVRVITPTVLRRGLFVGAVGALAIAPAQADRVVSPAHSAVRPNSLEGLRLPDRPLTSPPQVRSVVVERGDTLWGIAARSLPPGSIDADIARECFRWYAANRTTIGDDPDLIHPSQRLNPPTKDTA